MKKSSNSFLSFFFTKKRCSFSKDYFLSPVEKKAMVGERLAKPIGWMLKKWFCIAGVFAFIFCSAQQNNSPIVLSTKIDSLQNILKTTYQDTTSAAVYVALSEELYLSNIDTVIPLCLNAIQIVDAKIRRANSAEKKAFLLIKAGALNNIGYVYKQQGNITKALEWYNKSLKIREEIGNKYGIANSINNIGSIYNIQGNVDKAIELYSSSLKIQNEIGDKQGASISITNIGQCYYNQGDILTALIYYTRSLKIQEEIGDKQGIAISLRNMGKVYNTQNNFPKALEYYNKSLRILEEVGDKNGIAILLNAFGGLYKSQGESFYETTAKEEYFNKALDYYYKSLKIREETGDKSGIATSFNDIGFICGLQAELEQNPDSISSKFNKALEWNQKCLIIREEMGDKLAITNSIYNISGIYLKLTTSPLEKNKTDFLLKKAEEYCMRSLQTARELDNTDHIRNASERLYIIYKKMGELAYASGKMEASAQRFKAAMEMQELYKTTADKINNVELQKSIVKKQMQFEFKKREAEAKAKQKEIDDREKDEKQKQFFYMWIVVIAFLLAVAFTIFIYRSYRQKHKLNIELEKLSIVASETDNGVVICEPDGTLEWLNAGMVRLLGYTLKDWKKQGKTLQEISHDPDIQEKVDKSISSKQTVSYEALNITKDGRKIWVQSTLTPILNKRGHIKKLVVIDTDITERKYAESIIQEKNHEITDSIHAAKRIQHVLLASDSLLNKSLPEYFVLYKPKDIVSGDFYWANVIDDKFALITADCTGHGVPGAFMSLLNITYLNEAIIEKKIDSPEKILEHVRSQIISSLNPEGSEIESKDGMDAVLCIFDFKRQWLRFACANNPLWILRNNDLIKFKADKMPVGMHYGEQKPFSSNTVGLRKGDIIYTFTDGYTDQFGGAKGKKFKYKALKELLLSIQKKPMDEQKEILNMTFENWKGNLDQVDDVLIIGIRI